MKQWSAQDHGYLTISLLPASLRPAHPADGLGPALPEDHLEARLQVLGVLDEAEVNRRLVARPEGTKDVGCKNSEKLIQTSTGFKRLINPKSKIQAK